MNVYEKKTMGARLSGNPYAGRGIVIGKTEDGKKAAVAYFIMGRSENSRNRIFSRTDDGIKTEAYDVSKVKDPSLIIYNAVRKVGNNVIVTNGDQTDTVADFIAAGKSFYDALATRRFEPDEPNYTPRISAIINADGTFEMSILKHKDGRCLREFFCYEGCDEGKGYFISTYQGDGNPLPTFAGEPMEVTLPEADELWDALNCDNKVSLYANVSGQVKLYNKNLGD